METVNLRAATVKKLRLLFFLNLSDWLCTLVLLRSERFYEANPLMRPFFVSLTSGVLIKCLFPAAAILTVAFALKLLDSRELRIAEQFVCFALAFYSAVNLDHIINFFLLILSGK